MKPSHSKSLVVVCACLSASVVLAQTRSSGESREAALRRLQDAAGGGAVIATHRATGAARFIRLLPGARGLGRGPAATAGEKQDQSVAFFREYGAAVGIDDPRSLRFVSTVTDQLGETHLTWKQFYGSIPVFAGTIKTHFDASASAQGGDRDGDPRNRGRSDADLERRARGAGGARLGGRRARRRRRAADRHRDAATCTAKASPRACRARAISRGRSRSPTARGIRDFVYVDAHSGKVIDRISAVHDDALPPRVRRPQPALRPAELPERSLLARGAAVPDRRRRRRTT